jgi:hypothetical protein
MGLTRPPTDPLHLRRRRRAKIAQCPLAKEVWIALASFRKFNNFLGDYRDNGVISIRKPEGSARPFERHAHDPLGLGVESKAVAA